MIIRMGLQNRELKTYVNILDGKMSIKVRPGTPGALQRENKKKAIVHELRYDQISGFLTGFNHRTGEFGVEFLIDLLDDGTAYQIQVPWSSRHTKCFLVSCPNIDLKLPVTIRPYKFEPPDKKGKSISGLNVIQAGQKLPPAWAKERIPPMVKLLDIRGRPVLENGIQKWDSSDQMSFLWDSANSWATKAGLFNTLPEEAHQEAQPQEDDLPEDFR